MAKLAFILLICLTLHSVLSYYGHHQPPYPRVVYRHHVPYQPQASYAPPSYAQPSYAPPSYAPPSYAPPSYAPVAPVAPPVHYIPPPPPLHAGAARHVPYFAPPPVPPPHPQYHHYGYAPAASHQQSIYSPSHGAAPPPVTSPRRPFKNMFGGGPFGAFSHQAPKASIFTKIKPYIFGGQGQRSLPHHPYYPNHYHPHQFAPNRPFHNRPAAHHAYPVHAPPPPHSSLVMNPQKSCSCSLHVGQLTVYKHTDMRSSYSCTDLKDCNSFCTNLFSSEDLRAQTRADACLILGKDTTVPWFRRDHVCEPHGVKNDTKLSVDLCCKNLQPC